MDRHEADIVVEASKDRTHFIFDEIGASWSKQMSAALHFLCEFILFEAHADG